MAENWGMLENHFVHARIVNWRKIFRKCGTIRMRELSIWGIYRKKVKQHMNQQWFHNDVVLSVLGVIRGLWWKNCQFEESSEQSETTYEPAMISYWYCVFFGIGSDQRIVMIIMKKSSENADLLWKLFE